MSAMKAFLTVFRHPHAKGRVWQTLAVVVWWKFNQVFFHLPAIVEIAPQVKIICRPENSYGSFIVYSKWPEHEELQFILSFLGSKDVYIDVGAHIGDSSLLAASKIHRGSVFAFEPTPEVFAELMSNIRLNNFEDRIVPLQMAVSNKVGTATFSLTGESEVNHLGKSERGDKSIRVRVTTIDVLIQDYSISEVALLKIDVEGFELEVLSGAKKALKDQTVRVILFEVNPGALAIQSKVKKIQTLLEMNGYALFEFNGHGRLRKISSLSVPSKTSNFVAVSAHEIKTTHFKKWLV